MNEPIVAQAGPYVRDLKAGTYWWCRCGRSKNQPFCDGSHRDTKFEPQQLELTEDRKVALCGCKRTGNAPYCDGTHTQLTD
ncbi:MAG: CDGSH iron-sulfur domain-containing protein [Gammaproteobacteria bacterium]|nr:CDGSH iron-sulfur domain-containing protein [Gammaproteobacteria bacterium]